MARRADTNITNDVQELNSAILEQLQKKTVEFKIITITDDFVKIATVFFHHGA